MKASEVYEAVRRFVYNHDYKLENVYVHNWEADSFSVTSSLYSYEIEVKVSKSDFYADFKKPKHHYFSSYKKGYGIIKEGESWIRCGWPDTNKHPELNGLRVRYSVIKALPHNHKYCPNKFFFACPDGLIDVKEVPEYAGLLYCREGWSDVKVIKQAPYLHKDKINHKEMLFDKYYYQNIDLRNKLHRANWRIKDLEESIAESNASRPPMPNDPIVSEL